MTSAYDHLIVAIIVVLFPLYSWNETRKVRRLLAAAPDSPPFDIVTEYRRTIGWLVALAAICALNWAFQGRTADALGLGAGASSLRGAGAAALALAGLGLTWLQAMQVGRKPESRVEVAAQLEGFEFMLPRTRPQLRWFYGVSLAAGVCEEILYRGFLIWYLAHGIGPVPALLLSAIAFGVAHSYQGLANALRTVVVGLWLGAVFLISGSLWLAMAAHFVFDVIGGRMIFTVLSAPPAQESAPRA